MGSRIAAEKFDAPIRKWEAQAAKMVGAERKLALPSRVFAKSEGEKRITQAMSVLGRRRGADGGDARFGDAGVPGGQAWENCPGRVQAFDEGRIEQQPLLRGTPREAVDVRQQESRQFADCRRRLRCVGCRAFQERKVGACRAPEKLPCTGAGAARTSKELRDQPVERRHRLAQRCCGNRTIPFARTESPRGARRRVATNG